MRTLVPAKATFFASLTKRDEIEDVYNNGDPPIDRVNELMSALNQLVAAHSEKQAAQAATAAILQLSIADEILKFKQLLDAGVITQEEFDAKKRQLIG